jgi:hypothetical protein
MVKIGVCSANSGPYTTRDRLLELADAAEVVGLDVSPLPAGSVRVEAWILVAVTRSKRRDGHHVPVR